MEALSINDLFRILKQRVRQESPSMRKNELIAMDCRLRSLSMDIQNALNSRAAINRLPIEILREIFYQVPARESVLYRYGISCINWRSACLHWPHCVQLMMVCRRWREIMLCHTVIWDRVRNLHPSVFRRTSRQTSAILVEDGRKTQRSLRILAQKKVRLRELYWLGTKDTIWSSESLRASAAHLDTFVLHCDYRTRWCLRDVAFFEGETPILRRLALAYFDFLPLNTFTNLTSICLHQFNNVCPSKILACLAASSQIQDLAFIKGRFLRWVGDYPQALPLRHLKRLIISNVLEHQIIWLIKFPALTNTTSVKFLPDSHTTIAPLSSPYLIPLPPVVSSATRLFVKSDSVLAASASAGYLCAQGLCSDAVQLMDRLPLTQITEYCCDGSFTAGRDLIKRMPSLTALAVNYDHLGEFVTQLVHECEEPGGLMSLPCPQLTTMRLIVLPDDNFEAALTLLLNLRAQRGHPLSRVVIDVISNRLLEDVEGRMDQLNGCPVEWRIHPWASPNPLYMDIPDIFRTAEYDAWLVGSW